ncbi:alpha/beta fold hydrolase [Nitrincola alkalilacustris]|uniref:alpha/beta hydrolase family protein n=1 Tax=Nitrincola alkalilacustris TaxID=1571224 RepID=UPI00124D97BD|nr:alpha/beta hydrolase [Nitrincola alkalilacustris]
MVNISSKTLLARDGYPLAVRWFEAAGLGARTTLLIGSATAAPQTYYDHFASFLARQGIRVVTFDYRTIAASNHADWTGSDPTMLDWGRQDLSSLIDWVSGEWPLESILYLGHSIGGQLLGLTDNHHKVSAALMVASQNGYWKNWPRINRWRRWLDWHLLVPLTLRIYGRLPSFLIGGDGLPGSVAKEWSRWCRHPQFIHDQDGNFYHDRFAEVQTPMELWAFSDDLRFAPEPAVQALARYYANAPTQVRLMTPEEFEMSAIGHFGFFRRSVARPLWDQVVEWLEPHLISMIMEEEQTFQSKIA